MFRKNTRHQQLPLTSHVDDLPEKLRKRLENSWGGVFYREIYSRIEETPFAVLYADCGSRPNVAVNTLVGRGIGLPIAEILPLQLLALHISRVTGVTPGNFRYLYKVVDTRAG